MDTQSEREARRDTSPLHNSADKHVVLKQVDTTRLDPAGIQALQILTAAGYAAYLVGGAVRDNLLGTVAHDVDVACSASWEQSRDAFVAAGVRVVETGTRHGTITAYLGSDGTTPVEVTTFRVDGPYSDGRHPDSVRFVHSVQEDLARRDFTVNAMAWSAQEGLVDPFGGREDLADGVIRAVGEPSLRFEEDGLRVLRALRFASKLGFAIEPATSQAVFDCAHELDRVSQERIGAEYDGIICGQNAVSVLRTYVDVIARVVPEIGPMVGLDQHSRWHYLDVWEHCLRALELLDPAASCLVRHVTLLHDVGKPETFVQDEQGCGHFYGHEKAGSILARNVFRRLRWRSLDIDHACLLIRLHDSHIEPTARGVRRMLARIARSYSGAEEIAAQIFSELLQVKRADIAAHVPGVVSERLKQIDQIQQAYETLLEGEAVFRVRDLAVSGRDVMALGVARGPVVGWVLRQLLDRVIDERIANDRDALIQEAKRLIAEREETNPQS